MTPKVEGEQCNWCDDPAVGCIEIKHRIKGKKTGTCGTRMYNFHCERHRAVAERFSNPELQN